MADKHPLHQRHHASAKQSEEAIARLQNNDSYKLAFADNDFLLEDDLRHVRLQLEYLKPERVLDKHQIDATVVVFGSARFLSPEQAQYNLDIAQAELDKTPVYLLDPLGNLMMYYPQAKPDIKKVIKDLLKLLKYSRLG